MEYHIVDTFRRGKNNSLKVPRLAVGSLLTKNWKVFADPDITRVSDEVLDDVLRLCELSFNRRARQMLSMYCRFFNETCYAFLDKGKAVGYCIFIVEPVFSFSRMHKTATLYSIAVDSSYRGLGIGERLLAKGINEMRLNSVSCILLHVAVDNQAAISLYRKMGFRVFRELDDICGQGLKCYEMDMELK